ncbi:uncharacterized protein LOC119617821 [Kryptolebias marmoratus]|uniref:uncharacterized protein LOC119617821 n=1 Tax=Kryptolebias marmoratus TaxID=37003 RepID=UPI0018ACFF2C|nr:uncharacterized protein LOC119617821 [Kryptolebias marmoratus]
MNSSAMIQKSCIQIFLLITWNTCVYSGNAADFRFWLGCRALIPCQPPSVSSHSFKWFYKVDGESKEILLFSQDESGVVRYDASHRRLNVMPNRSLVIDNFTERDQGIYWCENCKKDISSGKSSIIFRVQKEILNEIQKTFFIIAGRSFTQTCSGEFPDLKWTFETSKTVPESERRPETVTETTNKSIHIAVVKNADAGKYTCWARRCGGPSQKLLTVNLCVLKIHHGEDSPLSCVVTCDVDLNNLKHISSLLIDNTTSVDVGPSGSLICNASQVTYMDTLRLPANTHHQQKQVNLGRLNI